MTGKCAICGEHGLVETQTFTNFAGKDVSGKLCGVCKKEVWERRNPQPTFLDMAARHYQAFIKTQDVKHSLQAAEYWHQAKDAGEDSSRLRKAQELLFGACIECGELTEQSGAGRCKTCGDAEFVKLDTAGKIPAQFTDKEIASIRRSVANEPFKEWGD